MKISMLIASVTFAAIGAALIPAASAQALPTQSLPIHVSIPFPFIVADRTLQAGDYTLWGASMGFGPMALKGAEGEQGLFVSTFPLEIKGSDPKVEVIFHRYGDTYFLSEVWTLGYKLGVWKSEQEKRELKGANVAPVEVALVAHN
jgi:hypothetical protein